MFINLEIAKDVKFGELRISNLIKEREVCGEIPIMRGAIKVPSQEGLQLDWAHYEEFSEKIFPGLVASKVLGKSYINPKPLLHIRLSKHIERAKAVTFKNKGLTRNDLKVCLLKSFCKKCKHSINKNEIIIINEPPTEVHFFPDTENQNWWGLAILYFKNKLVHSMCKQAVGYVINRKRLHYVNSPGVFTISYWNKLFPKLKIFGTVFEGLKLSKNSATKGPFLAVGETPSLD